MRDLADIFAGPGPAPEGDQDWRRLLDELEAAATVLAEKLRHEPGLSREAARLFCKLETNVPGVCFRSIVWPQARKLAGLPPAKGGRPKGSRSRKKSSAVLEGTYKPQPVRRVETIDAHAIDARLKHLHHRLLGRAQPPAASR